MQRTSVLTAVLLALTFGGFCRAEVSGWENHLSTDWVTKIIARDGKLYLAHTLNNTCIAPPRMLIAFLENNLQADGSVLIPEVLRPYMGGKDKLVPKH